MMNIKLKAFLLTFALLVGIFGFIFIIVNWPIVIVFAMFAVVFYMIYRLILTGMQGKV